MHRPAYLDYIGVKRFDSRRQRDRRAPLPRPLHDDRLLREPARDPDPAPQGRRDPRARRLPARQPQREGAASRSSRRTRATSCSRPRSTSCSRSRWGSSTSASASALRLFVRRDTFGRFLSLPRVRPARPLQHREPAPHRGDPARSRSAARAIDYTTRVSESVLVRLHYMIYIEPGRRAARLRRRRDRDDARRGDALVGRRPRGRARRRVRRGDAATRSGAATATRSRPPTGPTGSRARRSPTCAASRRWRGTTTCRCRSTARSRRRSARVRAKVFRAGGPLALSDMLPVFENMGVKVADERPYEVTAERPRAGLDLRLRPDLPRATATSTPTTRQGRLPGRLHPRLARRRRERRLQPAAAARAS